MPESEKSIYWDKFLTEFNLDDNKYMPHTVIFPPIGLNWPDYCIGCNKPNPSFKFDVKSFCSRCHKSCNWR